MISYFVAILININIRAENEIIEAVGHATVNPEIGIISNKENNTIQLENSIDLNSEVKTISSENKKKLVQSNEIIQNDNYLSIDHPSSVNQSAVTENEKCYVGILKAFQSNSLFSSLKIKYKYSNNLIGISFCANQNIIDKLTGDGVFVSIETDTIFEIASTQDNIPTHFFVMDNYTNYIFNNVLLNNFLMDYLPIRYIYKYLFSFYRYNATGKGINIYLLDTTVDTQIKELEGRTINLFTNSKICNQHGNIMSTTIAGVYNGFAKESFIKVINVMDCNGKAYLSDVLMALDKLKNTSGKTYILCLGISGPKSNILNRLIDKLSKKGWVIITAAGNNRDLACNYSPGSSTAAINVGSLNQYSDISKFSNFGGCIRIFSLGEKIETSIQKNIFLNTSNSGTSYAAALVTGTVALYLEKHPTSSVETVWKFLNEHSYWQSRGYLVHKRPDQYFYNYHNRISYVSIYFYVCFFLFISLLFFVILFIVRKYRRNQYVSDEELLFAYPSY